MTEATVPAQAAQTSAPSAAAMSRPSWVRQSARVSLYCRASAEKAATASPSRGTTITVGAAGVTGGVSGCSSAAGWGGSGFSGTTGRVSGRETSSVSPGSGVSLLSPAMTWGVSTGRTAFRDARKAAAKAARAQSPKTTQSQPPTCAFS